MAKWKAALPLWDLQWFEWESERHRFREFEAFDSTRAMDQAEEIIGQGHFLNWRKKNPKDRQSTLIADYRTPIGQFKAFLRKKQNE